MAGNMKKSQYSIKEITVHFTNQFDIQDCFHEAQILALSHACIVRFVFKGFKAEVDSETLFKLFHKKYNKYLKSLK